jgi:3-hydroxymyristoyl/3-hydroxydecanoyl-(acyl carrier protein) dehydratase
LTGSREICFSPDHPTAAGHFPGDPIIPGALLLDEVLLAIAADEGGITGACCIRSAKFLRPVRPGDRLVIRWQGDAAGETRFECFLLDPERLALTGAVQLHRRAP